MGPLNEPLWEILETHLIVTSFLLLLLMWLYVWNHSPPPSSITRGSEAVLEAHVETTAYQDRLRWLEIECVTQLEGSLWDPARQPILRYFSLNV